MTTFCSDIYFNKRIIKCVPLLNKKCYVFIGNYQDRFVIELIKSYINTDNPFIRIDGLGDGDVKIKKLYKYLTGIDIDNISRMKEGILDILFIPNYESFFIEELIYDDDTNEKVLMKISEYCYNINEPTPSNYIFSFYETEDEKMLSLNINYPDNLFERNIIDAKPCDLIDNSMIDTNGEQILIDKNSLLLNLFETNKLKDNIIKYISLREYLDKKNLFNDLQNSLIHDCEIRSFYNGMIYKYWPKISFEEVINYEVEKFKEKRIDKKQSEQLLLREYTGAMRLINRIKKKDISCESFEIKYMRIIKNSTELNNINISKLFNESELSENVPFVKLVLDNHNEKYFKVFKSSIIYNGFEEDINDIQTVDQELCKEWSDDFYIKSKYKNNVNYIHPNNVIIFKVYKETTKDIYCSLILHINGTIECIIKQRKNIKLYKKTSIETKEDIVELLKYCNLLINKINLHNISELPIIDFGKEETLEDIFKNNGDLIIDFIDCTLLFDKHEHKVKNGIGIKEVPKDYNDEYSPFKEGNQLPNWVNLIGNLMSKLPMYFRIKVEENDKIESEDRIIGHYNRVNNYANLSTIHSVISAYSNIYDPEEIITKVSREFGIDLDETKIEYESWKETTMMREKNKENLNRTSINQYNLNIEENGPDINIHKKSSHRYLQIDITNINSFNELNRIIYVIKSMIELYDNYINDKLNNKMKELFESDKMIKYDSININTEENYEEEDMDRKLNIAEILEASDEDSDVSFSSSEESSSQEGGTIYKIKSYHINRLKEYDPELFIFKSEKYQKNKKGEKTSRYGYPKVCTASKDQKRQPIVVTKDELDIIDSSEERGSGRESYSYAISIPGRPDNIKYICPQYWDMASDLSIHPKYVDKSNIVPNNVKNTTTKSIIKRDGTYWAGVTKDDSISAKYYIPSIIGDGIHPKGYGLPCCMSNTKRSRIYKKGDNVFWVDRDGNTNFGIVVKKDETKEKQYIISKLKTNKKESINIVDLNHIKKEKKKEEIVKEEEEEIDFEPEPEPEPEPDNVINEPEPEPEPEPDNVINEPESENNEEGDTISKLQLIGNIITKDETKPGQYAKLPYTLLKLFGQDKITEYDEKFKVSKGFLRKGVQHGKYELPKITKTENSEHIIISSLITTIIELIYSDTDNGIKGYNDTVQVINKSKNLEELKKKYELTMKDKIKKGKEKEEGEDIKEKKILKKAYNELKESIRKFIFNNIIKEFEADINKFRVCSSIIRAFRNNDITDSNKEYILKILELNDLNSKELLDNINDISEITNSESMFLLNMILSLKAYRDYLLSDEEKEIEVIAPTIQLLFKFDIILFENIENRIKIRNINSMGFEKVVFIYKKGKHYEPLIYRINRKGDELKIFNDKEFETKIPHGIEKLFKNGNYKEYFEENTYPRGRRNIEKLELKCIEKEGKTFCSEWTKCISLTQLSEGSEIKWIDNEIKNYAIVLIINGETEDIITTKGPVDLGYNNVYVKLNKRVIIPQLKELLENKKVWKWIDKSCSNYLSDINVEALIRRKKYPKKDKLLFDYSVKTRTLVDNEISEDLLELIQSEFFILIDIVKDLKNQIKIKENNEYNLINEEYTIKKIHLNSYSEVSYIITEKNGNYQIIPTIPFPLPHDNKYEIIYELTEEYLSTINETLDYLKIFNKKPISLIEKTFKSDENSEKEKKVITIILENDMYVPVIHEKIEKNNKLRSNYSFIESDCDILLIEKYLYNVNINDNKIIKFIDNYNAKEKYSRNMNYKIISKIEESKTIINGKIEGTIKNKIIYFRRYGKTIIKMNKNDYIHRNIYSKERNINNVILKGRIIKHVKNNIELEVNLVDIINNILSDNIMIPEHKRINLYGYLNYNKNNKYKLVDSEPRITDETIGKIISSDLNILKKFINQLLISGINKLKENISIKLDPKDYKRRETEILYSYEEYKYLDTLENIFTKKSSFKDITLNTIGELDNNIIKFKKVDTIPYYIQKLYGPGAKVLYHLNNNNNDLLNLKIAFNSTFTKKKYTESFIKKKICKEFLRLDGLDIDILDKYNQNKIDIDKILNKKTEKYINTQQIYKEIDNKIVHIPDLELLLQSFDINNDLNKFNDINDDNLLTDLAIILITYDKNKKVKLYFYSTKEIYLETKVISFHHTLIEYVDPYNGKRDSKQDKYILSNIISAGKYYSTIKDLFDTSKYHNEWIKKEDGTEIINKITPEWLEKIEDKEEALGVLNEIEEEQKEKESMLENIEKQRKEERIIEDELERIYKNKRLIKEKWEIED